MKRKVTVFLVIGILMLATNGCRQEKTNDPGVPNAEEAVQMSEKEQEIPTESSEVRTDQSEAQTENDERLTEQKETQAQNAFSFAALRRLEFYFSSGAGGWATFLTIDADGRFSGEYSDGNLGETGEGYPNGTIYRCNFSGQFTQPVKVNDYTYSVQINEMNYEGEPGTEEIIDGVRYCEAYAYGLDDAKDILIYLPGAPLAELPEEFRSWVGYYDLSATKETQLPFYALNNEAQQFGFSSYDMVDHVKELIAANEGYAADLEDSIQHDALTQAECDEKASELYEFWDTMLNKVWEVLKKTLDADTMRTLTEEEREWIAAKQKAAAEAGAEYEGGSIQSMMMTLKEVELTKERVYELLEACE